MKLQRSTSGQLLSKVVELRGGLYHKTLAKSIAIKQKKERSFFPTTEDGVSAAKI